MAPLSPENSFIVTNEATKKSGLSPSLELKMAENPPLEKFLPTPLVGVIQPSTLQEYSVLAPKVNTDPFGRNRKQKTKYK